MLRSVADSITLQRNGEKGVWNAFGQMEYERCIKPRLTLSLPLQNPVHLIDHLSVAQAELEFNTAGGAKEENCK